MLKTISVLALMLAATAVGASVALAHSHERQQEDVRSGDPTPSLDWGNDVLVGRTGTLPTSGKLSTDNDVTNGDIYVGILDPNTGTADTITTWRSTDGGQHWGRMFWFGGGPQNGGIKDFKLLVGSDADGTWLYTFVLFDSVLRVLRVRPPVSNPVWIPIAGRGDTIRSFDVDRNIETPQHLFICTETEAGRIYAMSSSDSAQTWGHGQPITGIGHRDPAICAGGNGRVYFAHGNRTDSTGYGVSVKYDNLRSPNELVWEGLDWSSDRRFRKFAIAADRISDPDSETVIALVTCESGLPGVVSPRYAWSRDACWHMSTSTWPPTAQPHTTWDARHPCIRRSYGSNLFRAVVTMREPTTNWDTLVYAYTRGTDPTSWLGRATPNDFRITGEFGGLVDYSSALGSGGGYVVYRKYDDTGVYFDGWIWTSGVEQPGGAPRATAIASTFRTGGPLRLHLASAGHVHAELCDGAGRVLATLYNGMLPAGDHHLPVAGRVPQGVYFLRLDLDGVASTMKLVQLR